MGKIILAVAICVVAILLLFMYCCGKNNKIHDNYEYKNITNNNNSKESNDSEL